jgi:hypothetical protein
METLGVRAGAGVVGATVGLGVGLPTGDGVGIGTGVPLTAIEVQKVEASLSLMEFFEV